ncbi:RWD domain-containing protein 3-like isoform X1 [Huso huso]|uniref:RWD domain-containing protein 3 n=1 Tax=Huso huso TaxID=61971 RepID=A0ABR0ZHI9_HUSHU|nr:RWD domain-containing protein 3 isoform X1 [Acipenser ruthenus]
MMSEVAVEEISALTAIFCEKDEFELLGQSETEGLTFRIQLTVDGYTEKLLLKLIFHLPLDYPSSLPDVSVSSEQLTRKQCIDIKLGLLKKATTLVSEPMVHELLLWLQQNFTTVAEQSVRYQSPRGDCEQRSQGETRTALLQVDHMRAKTKYKKIIEKWTSQLGLTGRLFIGKLILILLQGERKSIKDYLLLQKTSKVDVDSNGKKCKEKMMSVLCEMQLPCGCKQLPAFEVKDYSSLEELKTEFELVGLLELYHKYVHMLV